MALRFGKNFGKFDKNIENVESDVESNLDEVYEDRFVEIMDLYERQQKKIQEQVHSKKVLR